MLFDKFFQSMVLGCTALLLVPSSASAHHSEVVFDMESIVAFQGVVNAYSWRNPHIYVRVETLESGQPVVWEIQAGPTPMMSRRGWSKDSFIVGDRVTVRGNPERDPNRKYAFMESIEKEDGSVYTQGLDDPKFGAVAQSISGRWRATPESVGPAVQTFRMTEMTERGAAALSEYDILLDDSLLECRAMTAPVNPVIVAILYAAEIEIGEDVSYLRTEFYDTERVVYMDGREHSQSGERTNHGHSIGWWEGETLVVDTAQYSYHPNPYQDGLPSGEQKHMVEKFTLSDDGTTLVIELLLEDPEFLAESYSATVEWKYTPDIEMYAYNCDPEVSRQFNSRY